MHHEIRFNAFLAHSSVHQMPGLWRHPQDESLQHKTMAYWQKLARILERGKFDAIFLADAIGVNDVHGGSLDTAVRHGLRLPRHDPWAVVPVMAAVTQHLGFGVTGTLSYEEPYLFARKLSTLDHLTSGRLAWNIVTGYLESGAKAVGRAAMDAHDLRYDIADEFMEVVYKFWEGCWEDGALLTDRASGVFADPSKVHRIVHEGTYFNLEGIHMVDPSPQRTPVLYQAGASGRGRRFAGTHAECVFLIGQTQAALSEVVSGIRAQAEQAGRDPSDLSFLMSAIIIVDETEAKARARMAQYHEYLDLNALLGLISGTSGVDLSKYDLDSPYPDTRRDASAHTLVEANTRIRDGRVPTIREVVQRSAFGRGPVMVGSASQVADQLQTWVESTGITGFNLIYAVMPADYEAIADLLVPELQKRGVFKRDYRPGTLREKLQAVSQPLLPASHPAARHRVPGHA